MRYQMKSADDWFREDVLRTFEKLSEKLKKARRLFETEQIKESYETMWAVSSGTKRLSNTLSCYRCTTPDGQSFAMATAQEVAHLEKLNAIFADLQAQTRAKKSEIESEMVKKIHDNDPFVNDYEIEVSVYCMIGEDDPLFLDDDDNFICILQLPIFHVPSEDINQKNEYKNYNDMAHCQSHPLYGQIHCHFFHEILDHVSPKLSLDDVLRIDEVWIDIQVYYQKYQRLPGM